jgi:hypothetical protein
MVVSVVRESEAMEVDSVAGEPVVVASSSVVTGSVSAISELVTCTAVVEIEASVSDLLTISEYAAEVSVLD